MQHEILDAKIKPILDQLEKECREAGLPFIVAVGYDGIEGGTHIRCWHEADRHHSTMIIAMGLAAQKLRKKK